MTEYRQELNLLLTIDEIAAKIQHKVDQAALDKAADTLAEFGYVKVVRCRDCKYRYGCLHLVDDGDGDMRRCHATPDGFCSWAERRTDDNASSNA